MIDVIPIDYCHSALDAESYVEKCKIPAFAGMTILALVLGLTSRYWEFK